MRISFGIIIRVITIPLCQSLYRKTESSRSESSDSVEWTTDEFTLLREEIRELKDTLTDLVTGVYSAVKELGSRMDKIEE